MRRRFAILLTALLLVMMLLPTTTTQAAEKDYSTVRVQISIGSPTAIKFLVDGNYSVNDIPLERQLYTLSISGGSLQLSLSGQVIASGSSLQIKQHTSTEGLNNQITLHNTVHGWCSYGGDMVFSNQDGKVMLVNHIYLEDYLFGVVPYEMSNTWPLEALKSQAISARTYSVVLMNSPKHSLYDMTDTTHDQVYLGYNASKDRAMAAVDATAKKVLTSGGGANFVGTYYSSSNGGYTDIPQHQWTATNPILPHHVIQRDTFDSDNLYSQQEKLYFPKASGDVTYETAGSGKWVSGSGDNASKALLYMKNSALAAVKTAGYKADTAADIDFQGIVSLTPHTQIGNHHIPGYEGSIPCPMYDKATVVMKVMASPAGGGDRAEVSVTFDISLTSLRGNGFSSSILKLITVEETTEGWTIFHRRYGHGIGMSQWGAHARANAGHTCSQILGFYYPNTEMTDLSTTPRTLTPLAQSGSTEVALGDANMDGIIDIIDYTMVRQHILKLRSLSSSAQDVADADRNQEIDIIDYTMIRQHILQLREITGTVTVSSVPVTDTTNARVMVELGGYLNVRQSASTGSSTVGRLPGGARVQVLQANVASGWHAIRYGDITAYVSSGYISLD